MPDLSIPNPQCLGLSLSAIHDAHADFVWRCLQRLGVRTSDLEDLHQEVFLVVHKQLRTFDHSLPLRPWLFGICANIAASHRRRAYFRREMLVEQLPDSNFDSNSTPEDQVATQQELHQLNLILDSMDLQKRAVFVMFEIEGLACVDIAATIGVPLGTVYSRLSSARDEFQAATRRLQARSTAGGYR